MEPSNLCLQLIKTEEGLIKPDVNGIHHAYHGKKDRPGVWTIYYGITWYPNGKSVKEGDTCTREQGDDYLMFHVKKISDEIVKKSGSHFNQAQLDALTSMGFNVGVGGLMNSTLWQKAMINAMDGTIFAYNPNDPVRSCEFLKWVYSNGQVVDDLVERRMREADMYGNRPYHFKS